MTDNAQGELSSIEKAIHCYGVVGEIKAGTRSGKLAKYAKETGWATDVAGNFHQAGEVISATTDKSRTFAAYPMSYASLVSIHSLDRSLWPGMVEALVEKP